VSLLSLLARPMFIAKPLFHINLFTEQWIYFKNFSVAILPFWLYLFFISLISYCCLFFLNYRTGFTIKKHLRVSLANGMLLLLITMYLYYNLLSTIILQSYFDNFDVNRYRAITFDFLKAGVFAFMILALILFLTAKFFKKLKQLDREKPNTYKN
jgi:drug/metabolite transporter (DMT)-like permease